MSERIEQAFKKVKDAKRAALITYTMAGDPKASVSLEIMKVLAPGGADVIELGIPFSDPMADGPTIQNAAIRALQNGASVKTTFQQLKAFREGNQTTPVILMGYYNPILHYSLLAFCHDAEDAGADGLIIVDLPPEEDKDLITAMKRTNLSLIRLVAPTTNDQRLTTILDKASGFVYYISMAGITGAKSVSSGTVMPNVQNIKKKTDLPVCVGFGIKTPQHAKEIGKFADGVVVGSAIVDIISKNLDANIHKQVDEVFKFVESISKALK